MKRNSNSNESEYKKGLTEEEINSPEFNPDDFAPAPETGHTMSENENLENKRNSLVFGFVAALLALIICFSGWGVGASVDAYNEKIEEKQVLSVFENCDRLEVYSEDIQGYKVYAVFFKDKMAGYCVSGSTDGFGGKIDFLVAFNSDNVISQIKILDHSESMGLGSKITGDGFLSQFNGLLIGNTSVEYDLIAGATTSSQAVGNSIREILGLGLSTNSIANQLGYDTITEEEIQEEIKKEEDGKKDPEDTTGPSETTGTPNSGVSDHQGGSNINTGDGDIGVDGEDETTVYESETEKTDDTTGESTQIPETETSPVDSETTESTQTPSDSESESESESESVSPDSDSESTPPESESDSLPPESDSESTPDSDDVSVDTNNGSSDTGSNDPISDVANEEV